MKKSVSRNKRGQVNPSQSSEDMDVSDENNKKVIKYVIIGVVSFALVALIIALVVIFSGGDGEREIPPQEAEASWTYAEAEDYVEFFDEVLDSTCVTRQDCIDNFGEEYYCMTTAGGLKKCWIPSSGGSSGGGSSTPSDEPASEMSSGWSDVEFWNYFTQA